MWVYEEEVEVDGEKRKLTEVINQRHENVKCAERGPARTRLFGRHCVFIPRGLQVDNEEAPGTFQILSTWQALFTTEYFGTWQGDGSRYLPGIALPENIIAEPDVKKAAEGAHILVWVRAGCVFLF